MMLLIILLMMKRRTDGNAAFVSTLCYSYCKQQKRIKGQGEIHREREGMKTHGSHIEHVMWINNPQTHTSFQEQISYLKVGCSLHINVSSTYRTFTSSSSSSTLGPLSLCRPPLIQPASWYLCRSLLFTRRDIAELFPPCPYGVTLIIWF